MPSQLDASFVTEVVILLAWALTTWYVYFTFKESGHAKGRLLVGDQWISPGPVPTRIYIASMFVPRALHRRNGVSWGEGLIKVAKLVELRDRNSSDVDTVDNTPRDKTGGADDCTLRAPKLLER